MAASKVHTVKLVMSTALGEPENIKVSSRLTAGWVLPPKKIKDDEIPTISVDFVLGDTCDDWKTSQVAWVFHNFYRVSRGV